MPYIGTARPALRVTSVYVVVAIVMVENRRGDTAWVTGPVHAIHQKDVLPAVAVVVDNVRHTRSHSLRQIFFSESAAVVHETDPSRMGNVFKAQSARLALAGVLAACCVAASEGPAIAASAIEKGRERKYSGGQRRSRQLQKFAAGGLRILFRQA